MAKQIKRRVWTNADVRALKAPCKEENGGSQDRSGLKAQRGRNSAKSIQFGFVIGIRGAEYRSLLAVISQLAFRP